MPQIADDIFAALDISTPPQVHELSNKLERYLRVGPEHAPNPIQWWLDRHTVYPNLSRMALDYLTIPGTFLSTRAHVLCPR